MTTAPHPRIAVVPCYNEALTNAAIARDFNPCPPAAVAYVFDNNSSDDTQAVARAAGAFVRSVLELRMPVAEMPTRYKPRPEGSLSKPNTYRAGALVLGMIVKLFKYEKPLHFVGILAALRAPLALAGAPAPRPTDAA